MTPLAGIIPATPALARRAVFGREADTIAGRLPAAAPARTIRRTAAALHYRQSALRSNWFPPPVGRPQPICGSLGRIRASVSVVI
jgi:hypothetical protein